MAGPFLTVKASKEIFFLSAGVIGSPFILLYSGIGDRNELQAGGIKSILHLPSVGKNATDQPGIFTSWNVNSTDTLDDLLRNQTRFNDALAVHQESGRRVPSLDSDYSCHIFHIFAILCPHIYCCAKDY